MSDFDKKKWQNEMGAIVGPNGALLHLVQGTPGHVEFPSELIWQLHKAQPGVVYELAHTHPPGMTELSSRDIQTLKTWCYALSPFPLRMSTITEIQDPKNEFKRKFRETIYIGLLESKEEWIARGKPKSGRDFEVGVYGKFEFAEVDVEDWLFRAWEAILVKRSYGH